jgi:trehalose 6-phosphate synthase/phosphatase
MVALYSLSEIALITPLRDGMNLVAKEFVVCQTGDRGVLILSEMAGAAAELGEAVIINPSDRKEVGNAINRALCMPQKERRLLLYRMQKRLAEYDVFKWADDFLEHLFSSKKIQESRKVNILNSELEKEILHVYNQSSKRVLFFDYDGTLVPFSKFPEMSVISSDALNNLEKLAENQANSIVIISGRDKNFLQETFKDLNVYLIAEHGAFIMPPGGDWECKAVNRRSWKPHLKNILQRYVNRCNGSFIEEKETALVWHYRNADTELGDVRAGELRDELRDIVSHEPDLHMIDGHKVIEIKLAGYDKGGSVYEFLSKSTFDFVLAIGDDRTDEDIFNALPGQSYTFRIGMEPSSARFNIKSRKEVDLLIARLAGETI